MIEKVTFFCHNMEEAATTDATKYINDGDRDGVDIAVHYED